VKALLLALVVLLPLAAQGELPTTHPLRHPKLVVMYQPSGKWDDGWIYVHEVAAYVLGSLDERAAARAILEREGYGPKGHHYLFCGEAGKRAVADGQPFKTREAALEHLKKEKVAVAFYFSTTSSFPATIPGELTYRGTAFRVLDRFK
jgi:hypothetical protein